MSSPLPVQRLRYPRFIRDRGHFSTAVHLPPDILNLAAIRQRRPSGCPGRVGGWRVGSLPHALQSNSHHKFSFCASCSAPGQVRRRYAPYAFPASHDALLAAFFFGSSALDLLPFGSRKGALATTGPSVLFSRYGLTHPFLISEAASPVSLLFVTATHLTQLTKPITTTMNVEEIFLFWC